VGASTTTATPFSTAHFEAEGGHAHRGHYSTPDGKGYWLVAAGGGVFNYGDAHPYGSDGGKKVTKAIVGLIASAPVPLTTWSTRWGGDSLPLLSGARIAITRTSAGHDSPVTAGTGAGGA